MNRIRIINADVYHSMTDQMRAGKAGTIDGDYFELEAFDTVPIEGYTLPVNFPNCCSFHSQCYRTALEAKENFPNCCDEHKRLLDTKWFNPDHYAGMPMRLLTALSHSEYHIVKQINAPDWFDDITCYFEYCIKSFGQLPFGYGNPVGVGIFHNALRFRIQEIKNISDDKKLVLLKYLDNYFNPDKRAKDTDINILIAAYKQWLKAFPFSIPEFRNAKRFLENSLPPIISGERQHNKYLKTDKAKLVTKAQLIAILVDLTKSLLKAVDLQGIYKDKPATEKTEQTMILINENLRIKNNLLLGEYSKDETQYMKILKQWLTYQKEYFKEVVQFFKEQEKEKSIEHLPSKQAKITNFFRQYGFFELPKIKALSSGNAEKLIGTIVKNKIPYAIAMLDFLDFIRHLESEHFKTKEKLHKELSKWFDSDKDGRTIGGNISSLVPNTTEDKRRYTAHLHKKNVQNDYLKLK